MKLSSAERRVALKVAREHPTYVTGGGVLPRCTGCGEPIHSIRGYVNLGWNRHIAEATLAEGRGL